MLGKRNGIRYESDREELDLGTCTKTQILKYYLYQMGLQK